MTLPTDVHPFEARASDEELADLRARLAAARLPEPETVQGAPPGRERWVQGVPLSDLVAVVAHWRNAYDWRSFEDRLHEIGQFRTVIDGLGIHFLHRRSSRADATPLLMTHGWPGSVAEFVDVVDELADPTDPDVPAFHVVAPSLPGFGHSDKPATAGWGTDRIAAAWVELMGRLGYDEFVAHGGDWGGVVTTLLGGLFPDHVIGIHSTLAQAPPDLSSDGLTDEERRWAEQTRHFWERRAAYAKQQATRPQTIGYSLVDSPVGLLAWILDKFADWTDTRDSPFETLSMDRVLDDVTLDWLTRAGASAARIYRESHGGVNASTRPLPSTSRPPSASTPRTSRSAHGPGRRSGTGRSSAGGSPEAGGHFPSLEVPAPFVRDAQEGRAAVLTAHE